MEETTEQKIQRVGSLLDAETKKLTSSISNWHNYLETASKFYKYNFTDQILISSHNPDAELCADYNLWKNKFGRYIQKGEKGIPLLYEENGHKKIRYVFDISSTRKLENAKEVKVWELISYQLITINKNIAEKNNLNIEDIINKNSDKILYHEQNFADIIKIRIDTILKDSGNKYIKNIINHKKGTLLEKFDNSDIEIIFNRTAKYSIRYIVAKRCGFEPNLSDNLFDNITDFNSNELISQLGKAVSEISGTVLREIEREVKTIEKQTPERSNNYERHILTGSNEREIAADNRGHKVGQNSDRLESDDNIAGGRGISEIYGGERSDLHTGRSNVSVSSDVGNGQGRRIQNEKMGTAQTGIPEKREIGNIRSADDKGTLGTSDSDGQSGLRDGGQINRGNGESGERDRRTQKNQSDGMGRQNEQHQEQSERNSLQRTDLRLENTENKAEDNNSPAFSFARNSDLLKVNDLIAQANKIYSEIADDLKDVNIAALLNQAESALKQSVNPLEKQQTNEIAKKNKIGSKVNNEPNIIGNTTFKFISKKTYRKLDTDIALKAAEEFEKENIKYSGKHNNDNTITLTFSGADKDKCDNIIKKINIFTPEQIKAARETNLALYLQSRGQQLKQVGSEYTMPEHDSMRIKENKFYWNSQKTGGNTLDFCMTYYNMDFQSAVTELLNFNGYNLNLHSDINTKSDTKNNIQKSAESEKTVNNDIQKEHKPFPNELTSNKNRVTEYLHETRGISDETINDFLIKDKIGQDIKGNAIFKIFDKDGNISGAEISGTSEKRYKQTSEQNGNGFSFYDGEEIPKRAVFFESAIDLMSFYDMNKETAKDFLLVSMAGLKDKVVLKTVEDYGISYSNCFIASDYDEAGRKFADKMQKEYGISPFSMFDEDFKKYNSKDWNDLLKAENEQKANEKAEKSTENQTNENNLGIPQDIIEKLMKKGSNVENSKFRIENIYKNISDKKERISALKKEYGFGGMASPNNEVGEIKSYDFTSKGIAVGWNDEDGERNGSITWTTVEKEIEKLINSNTYISDDEREKYNRKNFVKAKIDLIKEGDILTIGNDKYTFLKINSGRLQVIPENPEAEYHFRINNLSTHKPEYFIHDFTLERNDFEISTPEITPILSLYNDSFENEKDKGEAERKQELEIQKAENKINTNDNTIKMTVYHGTTADFDKFRPDYRGAVWTATKFDDVKRFVSNLPESKIITAEAELNNPQNISFSYDENWDIDTTVRNAVNQDYDGIIIDFKFMKNENNFYKFAIEKFPDENAENVLSSIGINGAAKENETIAEFDRRMKENDYVILTYVAVLDSDKIKIIDKTNIFEENLTNKNLSETIEKAITTAEELKIGDVINLTPVVLTYSDGKEKTFPSEYGVVTNIENNMISFQTYSDRELQNGITKTGRTISMLNENGFEYIGTEEEIRQSVIQTEKAAENNLSLTSEKSENPTLIFKFGNLEENTDDWFTESTLLHDFVSEHKDISFALANSIIEYLDEKQHIERNNKELKVGWYEKTNFIINVVFDKENEYSYEGRYDIGDGKGTGGGSIINHIKVINDSERKNPYSDKKSLEQADFVLNNLIPILEENSDLTEEEKIIFENFKKKYPIIEETIDDKKEYRYEVTQTSDAYDVGENFTVWDNEKNDYHFDKDGTIKTFKTKEEAEEYLKTLKNYVLSNKETVVENNITENETPEQNMSAKNLKIGDVISEIKNTKPQFEQADDNNKKMTAEQLKIDDVVKLSPTVLMDTNGKEVVFSAEYGVVTDISGDMISFQTYSDKELQNKTSKSGQSISLLNSSGFEYIGNKNEIDTIKNSVDENTHIPETGDVYYEKGVILPEYNVIDNITNNSVSLSTYRNRNLTELIGGGKLDIDIIKKQEYIGKKEELQEKVPEQLSFDIIETTKEENAKLKNIEIDFAGRYVNDKYERESSALEKINAENFRITDEQLGVGTASEKYNNNINAIKTLMTIERENRQATPEEQEILSKYIGWGGLPDVFDERKPNWASKYGELKELLTEEEYISARSSVLNAHYTSPMVIKAMYKALENLGFNGGRILEPSMGVGNFFGCIPENISDKTRLYGVELDNITGRIAKQLYPKANIQIKGFEKTNFQSNFFDVAIGNVPFGDYRVNDNNFKSSALIHDYFFEKSLDKVKNGGVIAFITSKGTLDKKDNSVRKYLAERADLLGAVRLPNETFKANAGTDATFYDIIFLQKKDRISDFTKEPMPDWVNLSADKNGLMINNYFVEHSEMICGEMTTVTGAYGLKAACKGFPGKDFAETLNNAVNNIKGKIAESELVIEDETKTVQKNNIIPENYRNFCYAVIDDKIYFRENGNMTEERFDKTKAKRIKAMVGISEALRDLITAQKDFCTDEELKKLQIILNTKYEDFTNKFGLLSDRKNKSLFREDDTAALLLSLENLNDKGEFIGKADIFTKRTIIPYVPVDHVDTSSEALIVSISERAKVDLDFMSQLCGKKKEEIIEDLKGVIFKNPRTNEYENADEYLSGNIRKKLETAKFYAKDNPEYEINVSSLAEVIPPDLKPSEISIQLGSAWVPAKYYEQFIYELLDTSNTCRSDYKWKTGNPFESGSGGNRNTITLSYDKHTATFGISNKTADRNNLNVTQTYGTKRMNAYKIIEETLNMKPVKVMDYVEDAEGRKKAVLNQKETLLAQEKQSIIKNKFEEWIFNDPERTEDLCRIYNDNFNSVRPREYDGSHITFGGINPEIKLRKHQIDAIAHTLYGGNTLLAHTMGAGKTFEMAASAMESKRLGLCTKSMLVVPKHIVNQFANEFLQLYPTANILVPNEKDFSKDNRERFCSRIATGNYDAIIISHTQLEKIPLSQERQINYIQNEIDETIEFIESAKEASGQEFTVKQLETTKKNLEDKLEKLNNDSKRDTTITFEELGIDKLYVDEAHLFKNKFFNTKMGRNVAGINASSASQRAEDLAMKCQYLDELTGSKGCVFATGTPLSNSVSELYTMQSYLQRDMLKARGLNNFDAWASCFGETKLSLELAPEGKGYQTKMRFAKFVNLPELINMFKEMADIKTAESLNLPVPKANYHTIATEASDFQKKMVDGLAERADKIRKKQVAPEADNMLAVTNDGRKLALDQRLMNDMLPDDPNSKVNECVKNVYKIWEDTTSEKSTQLIFCDQSTPKNDGSFNVYDDIKKKLISKGIPENEIAFIHSCKNDEQKQALFTKVRNGEVRVLLGSTNKMGTGTNCQKKLKALHHIDCPYRPSDLSQRNGRIIRQGNENAEVDIFNYVTKSTFDSYLFQLVENKQRFISQIMTNKSPARSADDLDECVLSYAQIKALAAGNPKISEKMNLDIEVAKLRTIYGSYLDNKRDLQQKITKTYPESIQEFTEKVNGIEKDISVVHSCYSNEFNGMIVDGKTYTDKKEAGAAFLESCRKLKTGEKEKPIGRYKGFEMSVSFDSFSSSYYIALKNNLSHKVEIGNDTLGNITRIDNALNKLPEKLNNYKNKLEEINNNLKLAKLEVDKPFSRLSELREKESRLEILNKELSMENNEASEEKEKTAEEKSKEKNNSDIEH